MSYDFFLALSISPISLFFFYFVFSFSFYLSFSLFLNHFNKIGKYANDWTIANECINIYSIWNWNQSKSFFSFLLRTLHCIDSINANKLITFRFHWFLTLFYGFFVLTQSLFHSCWTADLLTCKAHRYFITLFCQISMRWQK